MSRRLVGIALVTLASACGHPATREECEIIVRKNAELELRKRNSRIDEQTIQQRTTELVAARGEDLYKACVGRHVTKKALACVEKAATERELDACFD